MKKNLLIIAVIFIEGFVLKRVLAILQAVFPVEKLQTLRTESIASSQPPPVIRMFIFLLP